MFETITVGVMHKIYIIYVAFNIKENQKQARGTPVVHWLCPLVPANQDKCECLGDILSSYVSCNWKFLNMLQPLCDANSVGWFATTTVGDGYFNYFK